MELIAAAAVVLIVLRLLDRGNGTTSATALSDALSNPEPGGITGLGYDLGDPGTQASSYSLDSVVNAVARRESGNRQYNPDGSVVTSSAGALGVMQLMPGTAAGLGVDPYDEQQNRAGGQTYLQQLFNKYGNWDDALAAYNWGPGNVDKANAGNYDYPNSVYDYVSAVEGFITG